MHINCLEERKMQREKEEEREGGQTDTFHVLLGFRRRIRGPAGFSPSARQRTGGEEQKLEKAAPTSLLTHLLPSVTLQTLGRQRLFIYVNP